MSENYHGRMDILKEKNIVHDDQNELSRIEEITRDDREPFYIIGPKKIDSTGTEAWKKYLDRRALREAWCPPEGSPYNQFFKTTTINSIEYVGSRLQPRYSKGERNSEDGLRSMIESGELGPHTGIILDSGGAHSVAMAVRLVEQGYQPIVMLDSVPHTRGLVSAQQNLATLLYYAEHMHKLKQKNKIKPDAPPVFILDTHRDNMDSSFGKDVTIINNTNTYTAQDFPSSDLLKKCGINKIVYLNEGGQNGEFKPKFQSIDRLSGLHDLRPIAQQWMQNGITISYTGIKPWKEKWGEVDQDSRGISNFPGIDGLSDKHISLYETNDLSQHDAQTLITKPKPRDSWFSDSDLQAFQYFLKTHPTPPNEQKF